VIFGTGFGAVAVASGRGCQDDRKPRLLAFLHQQPSNNAARRLAAAVASARRRRCPGAISAALFR